MSKRYSSLQEIVEQLELCDYKTSDQFHELKNNAAFVALKERASTQQIQPVILREIMKNLKSAIRKKGGSVFFQSSVSSETWEFFIKEKQKAEGIT